MNAKVYELLLLKENFEHVTGLKVSTAQWVEVAEEIAGRMDNFFDELIEQLGAELADKIHGKIEMGA